MVLEAGKTKIKVLADSFPGASSPPALQMQAFSRCPHVAEGESKKTLRDSSCKVTNPIMRTPPS